MRVQDNHSDRGKLSDAGLRACALEPALTHRGCNDFIDFIDFGTPTAP